MSAEIKIIKEQILSDLIKSSFQLTPIESKLIDNAQKLSYTTWAGFHDGKLVCTWGVITPSILSDSVYLWLHTTPVVKDCQFIFVRRSQLFIENLLKEYNYVVGHVRKDEPRSQRWLRWLGAEFSPSKEAHLLNFRITSKWHSH